jgi:hypothetical protein
MLNGCEAGCTNFSCGSIGHHKYCQHYPESLQKMVDDKNIQIEQLRSALKGMLTNFGGLTSSGKDGWARNEIKAARVALGLEKQSNLTNRKQNYEC